MVQKKILKICNVATKKDDRLSFPFGPQGFKLKDVWKSRGFQTTFVYPTTYLQTSARVENHRMLQKQKYTKNIGAT